MPLYEYVCQKGHRFEAIRPIERRNEPIRCEKCRGLARLMMSRLHWTMGWGFLRGISERAEEAPNDAGYYPEWDD